MNSYYAPHTPALSLAMESNGSLRHLGLSALSAAYAISSAEQIPVKCFRCRISACMPPTAEWGMWGSQLRVESHVGALIVICPNLATVKLLHIDCN